MSISAEHKGLLRSAKVAAFAFVIIGMMLAAPLLTAFGSDAEIAEDKAGFSISMTNPTDQELDKYGMNTKVDEILEAGNLFTKVFNDDIYEVSKLVTEKYDYKASEGVDLGSKDWFQFMTEEVFVNGLSITFVAVDDGDLIDPNIADSSRYKAAANAIKAYFGNEVYVGDTMTVEGKLNYRYAVNFTCDYAKVDSEHSVVKGGSNTTYRIYDMDIKITFKKMGVSDSKTIQFHSDDKFLAALGIDYDYMGVKYADLTDESPCKITYNASVVTFHTGKSYFTVNEDDYIVGFENTEKHVEETTAKILTDSNINLNEFRKEISEIPASAGNVTVKKNFSDAESMFDSIVLGVIGNDVFKGITIVLLAAGAAIAIIAIIVIVFVLVKKHKQ